MKGIVRYSEKKIATKTTTMNFISMIFVVSSWMVVLTLPSAGFGSQSAASLYCLSTPWIVQWRTSDLCSWLLLFSCLHAVSQGCESLLGLRDGQLVVFLRHPILHHTFQQL